MKQILNFSYGIEEAYIIDNHLYKYNSKIISMEQFKQIPIFDVEKYAVLLASTNTEIYESLKENVELLFSLDQIAELEFMHNRPKIKYPVCGKYSYGPLKQNIYVESIGAFCSIAEGCCVVGNHAMDYITTHDIVCAGSKNDFLEIERGREYDDYKDREWYFSGIQPHGVRRKSKKSRIGNDVWLGQNVIITNGADIGNGVIACAGSVITQDVPDYAIVGGVPAKIIKFRYKPDEIEALNRIAWWNWSDDEIRSRYEDLYLSVEKFIKKYDCWGIS